MFALRISSRVIIQKPNYLHRKLRRNISLIYSSFAKCNSLEIVSVSAHPFVHTPTRNLSSHPLVAGGFIRSPLPDIGIPDGLTCHDLILQRCEELTDKLAFIEFDTGRTMTYTDLKSRVLSAASALNRLGLVKGDVILVCATNNMDTPVLGLACSMLGVWYSPVNSASTTDDLCRYINETKPRMLFCSSAIVPVVQETLNDKPVASAPEHVYVFGEHADLPSFDALLQDDGKAVPDTHIDTHNDILGLPWSSGTSGLPKGVMISNHTITANIMQMQTFLNFLPEDRILGLLPFYHIYGLVIVQLAPLYAGSTIVVTSKFTPDTFLTCIQNEKITMAPVVPPLLLFLAKSPTVANYDLSSVQRVMCGAAPLGKDLISEFQARFPSAKLMHGFGMTEVIVASCTKGDDRLDSVGYMMPNTIGKIVDPTTQENLGPNKNGEFMMKGPQVCKGYFNKPEATAEMLTSDGWIHTGDLGYYTEDGLIYITDRLKEFIKYKGHQVAPAELEDLLLGHPEVQDVGVTRKPDEAAGEVPVAFVVKKPGSELTEEDVCKFVKEKTSPEKWLRGGVIFIEEIPKSASGKILRRLLREKYID